MSRDRLQPVFRCRQCGECCAGRGGIHVTSQEVERMAALLDLPVEEFCRRYVETSPLGPRLTVANGVCVFLMPGNLCRVHPVKPRICRQWPFLPALLAHPEELEYAKTACPGIDPDCTHEDFVNEALGQGATAGNEELASAGFETPQAMRKGDL